MIPVRADRPYRKQVNRWRTSASGIRLPRLGVHIGDHLLALLMVLPALVLMLLYVLYPLVTVIYSSVMQWDTLTSPGRFVGLQNFSDLFSSDLFRRSLARSGVYTVGNILLQIAGGVLIALLLNKPLPGRNVARGVVLFPFIVPGVVAALIWQYLLNDYTGVVNYLLSEAHLIQHPLGWLSSPKNAMTSVIVISAWKYVPFMTVLFLARLQTIPTEVVEAARCDGASAVDVFRYITLPWITPVLAVAVMLRTIWSFNEFDMPFLLTQGGPSDATLVLPILIREFLLNNLDVGKAAAVSMVMILVLVASGLVYIWVYNRSERTLDEA